MDKKAPVIFSIFVLAALALACAGNAPAEPQSGVETIVAQTLQALTQPVSSTPAVDDNPAPQNQTGNLLPRSLHFLNADSSGRTQVFRLETDGKTLKQITFEPASVEYYDVSKIDGSIVFISNNQLFTIRADGSNRAMIFDGGAKDEVNPFLNVVTNPVWSPDGQTIAFGYKGLNFYSIVSGQSTRVLENQVDTLDGGYVVPKELYSPDQYSNDGSKLVVTLGYYEGASSAVYRPGTNGLLRMSGENRGIICCGEVQWNQDGSAFYAASPSFGMFDAGLWRVDANTGLVTTLLIGTFDITPLQLADEVYPAPDGQLYFFYGTLPNADSMGARAPLQIVRSGLDGITGRTVLRPEVFMYVNEALWAPDASLVVVVNGSDSVYQGGKLELYYTDGQKAMIPLAPFGYHLKWGP